MSRSEKIEFQVEGTNKANEDATSLLLEQEAAGCGGENTADGSESGRR